ncbi:MAG TPA: AbiV family abortive infection protein [Ohtaekwangia sp.]|nr:AbiV family abortive infection protein [Ohtaekwangia sp.]
MGAKGFLHLSKKNSLAAFKAVLQNSDLKWNTAAKVAKTKDYGTAISIAVASVEEVVKALIIAMNGYGFEFRKAPSMQRFFKNHQIRYVVAYAMFLVNVFSQELKELFLKINSNPVDGIDWMNRIIANDPREIFKIQAYARLKFRLIKKEFQWFEKVDTFRQEGMYSDFDDGIKSPVSITKKTYAETIGRLEKVRKVGLALIETLESKDHTYINHYKMLKSRFIQDQYYERIETTLKNMSRPSVPFESIRTFFSDGNS